MREKTFKGDMKDMFEIGNLVRCVDALNEAWKMRVINNFGTIIDIDNGDIQVKIRTKDYLWSGWFDPKELEKA